MPHLGDAAHARADLQSKRESVHAREARWLRRTARGGAADYSSTHHQEPAARGLKDGDAERLRERAVQEDSPAHEHVPHLLCRCSQGAPRAAAANGRPRNGQHALQRAPTEPERRPSVHVGVHAVCVHARACVCDRRASVAWTAPRSSTRWCSLWRARISSRTCSAHRRYYSSRRSCRPRKEPRALVSARYSSR